MSFIWELKALYHVYICKVMQSSEEITQKKLQRKNNRKSSRVIFMLRCSSVRLCESDPATPLLYFPVVVLSQEQMAKPAPQALLSWKRSTSFPALPLPLKCTPMRMCLAISSQNQKRTAAQWALTWGMQASGGTQDTRVATGLFSLNGSWKQRINE